MVFPLGPRNPWFFVGFPPPGARWWAPNAGPTASGTTLAMPGGDPIQKGDVAGVKKHGWVNHKFTWLTYRLTLWLIYG